MKLRKTIPAFPVHHIAKAVNFYTEKFGFDCPYQNTGFAILKRNDLELHLWASNDRHWKWTSIFLFLRPIRSGAESFLAGTHSCRIEVEGIDKLYDELKPRGVLYNDQIRVEKKEWGTREFPTLDLHGNLLTFFERIK